MLRLHDAKAVRDERGLDGGAQWLEEPDDVVGDLDARLQEDHEESSGRENADEAQHALDAVRSHDLAVQRVGEEFGVIREIVDEVRVEASVLESHGDRPRRVERGVDVEASALQQAWHQGNLFEDRRCHGKHVLLRQAFRRQYRGAVRGKRDEAGRGLVQVVGKAAGDSRQALGQRVERLGGVNPHYRAGRSAVVVEQALLQVPSDLGSGSAHGPSRGAHRADSAAERLEVFHVERGQQRHGSTLGAPHAPAADRQRSLRSTDERLVRIHPGRASLCVDHLRQRLSAIQPRSAAFRQRVVRSMWVEPQTSPVVWMGSASRHISSGRPIMAPPKSLDREGTSVTSPSTRHRPQQGTDPLCTSAPAAPGQPEWGADVIRSVFGSTGRAALESLRSWVEDRIGPSGQLTLLRSGMVAVFTGVSTGHGRIVVRLYQPGSDPDAIRRASRVQSFAAQNGFPAAEPVAEPARCRAGWAVIERYLSAGPAAEEGWGAPIAVPMAATLGRLARVGAGPATGSIPFGTFRADEFRFQSHSALFDFEANAEGARWIDDCGRAAHDALMGVPGSSPVVTHRDWRLGNVEVAAGEVRAIYDWDSLWLWPEAEAAGAAAAGFGAWWDRNGQKAARPEEAAEFLRAYERTRDRPFTTEEWVEAGAAAVLQMAYVARCEQSLGWRPDDGSAQAGLRPLAQKVFAHGLDVAALRQL